jgi:hypothetical protein
MITQAQTAQINNNVFAYTYRLAWVLFLLVSSIVIADSTLKLDFPDEFYLQSTDKKLSRGDETYRTDKEEPEWRKPADSSSPTVRWGAKTIYEENRRMDPLVGTSGNDQTANSINLAPQLEIRF